MKGETESMSIIKYVSRKKILYLIEEESQDQLIELGIK